MPLLCMVLVGCCQNTIKEQATSPDGKYTAILFIRDCGATTAYSPQVQLVRGGTVTAVNGLGNVFIGDKDDRVKIVWNSTTNLTIYATPDCRISSHQETFSGITIKIVQSWEWLNKNAK